MVKKRFRCNDCGHTFERDVLETVFTAACPNCKPLVAFLEWLGLTPAQAIGLTALAVVVGLVSRN
jgi:uncharacterized paraquat-inducible protein A